MPPPRSVPTPCCVPFEEELHRRRIEALVLAGKISQAREHYDYFTRFCSRELGHKPSLELEQLLKPVKDQSLDTETELHSIRQKLLEPASAWGDFFCRPKLFQSICRLEARRLERSRNTSYLCQFLLKSTTGDQTAGELSHFCHFLEEVLLNCLHKSDVVCHWSRGHYLALLSGLTAAGAAKLAGRIVSLFDQKCGTTRIRLHTAILPLLQSSPEQEPAKSLKSDLFVTPL